MTSNRFLNCLVKLGQCFRLGRDSTADGIIPRSNEDIRFFVLFDFEFDRNHLQK